MPSHFEILKLAYDTFMAYNPVTLAYLITIKLEEHGTATTCPMSFWGLFGVVFSARLIIPMFILSYIFYKYTEKKGENHLLYRPGEMSEDEQVEAIWRLYLERQTPYLLNLEQEGIVVSEKQEV